MDTLKIAALYARYTDLARLLDSNDPNAEQALLSIFLLDREDAASQTQYEVRVCHFAPEGVAISQRCPWRVFDWACAQFPADGQHQSKGELWSAMANDFSEAGGTLMRYGSAADFATLLRGMRHYQRKLNRDTKKQLAQLRAYHAQQLAAEAEHAELLIAATTSPVLPHYGITRTEYARRIDAAEDLVEQLRAQYNPAGCYGHEVMWHHDFAAACVASISSMSLHEVEFFLSGNLANDFRRGQFLDYADYAYLGDLLREGLTDNPTPLAALRLARALAWVEQAGAALLTTEPPVACGPPVPAFEHEAEQRRRELAEGMNKAQGFATL